MLGMSMIIRSRKYTTTSQFPINSSFTESLQASTQVDSQISRCSRFSTLTTKMTEIFSCLFELAHYLLLEQDGQEVLRHFPMRALYFYNFVTFLPLLDRPTRCCGDESLRSSSCFFHFPSIREAYWPKASRPA